MPGTSGRIAASQAAKQPKTCDPSYPSLDLVRELPRARGVGESELTRTRERPRQAQLKAWAFDAPSKAHEQLGDDGFDTTSPKQGLRFRRIIVGAPGDATSLFTHPLNPWRFQPHITLVMWTPSVCPNPEQFETRGRELLQVPKDVSWLPQPVMLG